MILRIKHQAEAAASVSEQPGPEEGHEMAAAYDRLRNDARELNRRAGWGDDDQFEAEIPPLDARSIGRESYHYASSNPYGEDRKAFETAATRRQARVLLKQLAA